MNDVNFVCTVEVFECEDGSRKVWIGADDGSGAEYPITNELSIGDALNVYLSTYYPQVIKPVKE